MKFTSVLLATALAVATASDVVDLNKDTFQPFVEAEKLSLIEFFAPWCGHCKALAPEYEVAATKLLGDKIKIAKVDCTVEADICEKQGVKGYPTIKVFRDGVHSEYKGARTADGIIEYMAKQNLPALSKVKADNVEKFTGSAKVVVLAKFTDEKSDDFKNFSELANAHRDDFVFGYVTEGVKKADDKTVTLYKKFDEGKNVYEGKFAKDPLMKFIRDNSIPIMSEIGPENYKDFVARGLPIGYLFYDSPESRAKYGAFAEPLAKANKGKISFVYIDSVKFGGHAKSLNLKETWPAFAIQNPTTQAKYPLDQEKEMDAASLKQFVEDFVAGKIEPSVKSEPEPESNDAPVKIIVGTNFESIVMDKAKDVFLELYAPWCGHCKKLSPIWDELGEKMVGSNVIIAKMDGTENDLPASAGFAIEGFPTLKFFKAETNEIIDYDGDRSLESLVEFVKTNAHHADSINADIKTSGKPEEAEDEDEHDEL